MMDPHAILTNGAGEVASLELAEPSTQIKLAPPRGEQGSAYDPDQIFTRFDEGRYFSTRDLFPRDFEEMLLQDGKARTLEAVLTLPLMSAEFAIEPREGDNGEAEFVQEALETPATAGGMSTPFEQVIGQMTSAVVKRRAYFEKVFKPDGGRILYDKVAFRPQSSCYLLRDKTNFAFRGFKQKFLRDDKTEDVTIKPEKAFVYIHGQWRDPLYGVSRLDTAFNLYQSKQKVRFLWFSFLENQVLPKSVAQHDTPDAKQQRAFAEKVAELKGGGVVGIGPGQSVTPLAGDAVGGEFKMAMDYLSSEQANSVLAGFTDLASAAASGRGSFALSSDQSDFYLMSLNATLTEMATAIVNWLVADLVLYNFGTQGVVPEFKFRPPHQEVVQESFTLLQALATSPSPGVPREFIDLLTEKVAAHLGISVDQVHKAIEKAQENAPEGPAAQMQAGVEAATRLVHSAGLGAQPAQVAPAANLSEPEPERRVELATSDVNVEAPQVTVDAPVTVEPAEAPKVEVHAHIHRGEVEIVRDEDGQITGARPKEDG